jgi:hypothetical protein
VAWRAVQEPAWTCPDARTTVFEPARPVQAGWTGDFIASLPLSPGPGAALASRQAQTAAQQAVR